ncbi:hypothetical protein EmuJ_001128800 [Echinococcus multilocularis]|uniref:Uncharacterized protein n=1 Tax=Echinococcus multilocularis TaxID=6211 RepID=A0A068YFI1_ECHMU|nr:hypothetical protein EmuJ_001128800 [Echinococcus multilocularis]
MKPSFLSRFTRSTGCAPAGWPTDDVAEIDASANELKKITADILKKLSSYFPPPSSSTLQPLDLASFSFDSLQLFGSSGDRLLNRAAELEGTRQKQLTAHNSHQLESNGFSTCSSDTRSQEHELNAEGGSRSYGDSSSKETPKNGESTETRFFTSGNTMVLDQKHLESS